MIQDVVVLSMQKKFHRPGIRVSTTWSGMRDVRTDGMRAVVFLISTSM